jgi:hypothetical protein
MGLRNLFSLRGLEGHKSKCSNAAAFRRAGASSTKQRDVGYAVGVAIGAGGVMEHGGRRSPSTPADASSNLAWSTNPEPKRFGSGDLDPLKKVEA